MKISLEWLNEFVDLSDITPEQIAHELTMSGLEVEDIEKKDADEEKEKRMQKAILDIKNRFGPNAVMKGTSYQDAATGLERNMSIGGHKG